MDYNALINNFGLPTTCVCACGWFIWQLWSTSTKENATREERNYEMLSKFQISIDKFADILDGYQKKLTIIECDVKEIKEIVNK